METILRQLKDVARDADTATRRSLLVQLRALQLELEQPNDTIRRVMFLNCQMAVVRIGIDLKIFNHLAECQSHLTVAQIAEKASADPTLVGRILRYLACTGYIKEEGQDIYSGNHITSCLADPNTQAGMRHYFDFLGPVYQSLPEYLEEGGYKNIINPTKTLLHYVYKTDLMPWDWFQTQPKKALAFSTWAAAREKDMPTWTSTYPLAARGPNVSSESPLFVDVGGGFGQQSQLVRDLFPELEGRIILQDFPIVLDNSPARDNVEKMPHNFFQPQPDGARGARFYYLRQVLHDHSDEQAIIVLNNVKDVMEPGSFILIDEIVIPNTGADWMGVHMDIVVMAGLAGMERSLAQWEALLKGVGLRCRNVYRYNHETSDAILEVVADE